MEIMNTIEIIETYEKQDIDSIETYRDTKGTCRKISRKKKGIQKVKGIVQKNKEEYRTYRNI